MKTATQVFEKLKHACECACNARAAAKREAQARQMPEAEAQARPGAVPLARDLRGVNNKR